MTKTYDLKAEPFSSILTNLYTSEAFLSDATLDKVSSSFMLPRPNMARCLKALHNTLHQLNISKGDYSDPDFELALFESYDKLAYKQLVTNLQGLCKARIAACVRDIHSYKRGDFRSEATASYLRRKLHETRVYLNACELVYLRYTILMRSPLSNISDGATCIAYLNIIALRRDITKVELRMAKLATAIDAELLSEVAELPATQPNIQELSVLMGRLFIGYRA